MVATALFFCLASFVGADPYTYQPRWWNFLLADYDRPSTAILVPAIMAATLLAGTGNHPLRK